MKKKKGEYGSRDEERRRRLMWVLIFAAAVIAQLAARIFADTQAAKNILTVMAILTVLPMANFASPLLASWRYKTPAPEFYNRVRPYEDRCQILYDLILTTKESVMPMDAIAVHPNGIYAFCTAPKLDTAKAEKSLTALAQANHISLKIKIFLDERSFFRRLDTLKAAKDEDGQVEATVRLLKNLSM